MESTTQKENQFLFLINFPNNLPENSNAKKISTRLTMSWRVMITE